MTNFTIDCEFDGFGGELISLAIVGADRSLYLVNEKHDDDVIRAKSPWVKENVIPILFSCPQRAIVVKREKFPYYIKEFFEVFSDVTIHADWPDDIKYFCECLITGPGTMISTPKIRFVMSRVDSYPNNIEGAVQHNAWWDALCLFEKLKLK